MQKTQSDFVRHTLEPVFDENSHVLILGSLPSPKSRESGFYYGHVQNRFWKVLAGVYGEEVPQTNDEKKSFVLRHKIALWDVIESCRIYGASDSSITDVTPNDMSLIFSSCEIRAVFTLGAKAYELYNKLCLEHAEKHPAVKLPSTSPANAAWSLEKLVGEYSVIKNYTC